MSQYLQTRTVTTLLQVALSPEAAAASPGEEGACLPAERVRVGYVRVYYFIVLLTDHTSQASAMLTMHSLPLVFAVNESCPESRFLFLTCQHLVRVTGVRAARSPPTRGGCGHPVRPRLPGSPQGWTPCGWSRRGA